MVKLADCSTSHHASHADVWRPSPFKQITWQSAGRCGRQSPARRRPGSSQQAAWAGRSFLSAAQQAARQAQPWCAGTGLPAAATCLHHSCTKSCGRFAVLDVHLSPPAAPGHPWATGCYALHSSLIPLIHTTWRFSPGPLSCMRTSTSCRQRCRLSCLCSSEGSALARGCGCDGCLSKAQCYTFCPQPVQITPEPSSCTRTSTGCKQRCTLSFSCSAGGSALARGCGCGMNSAFDCSFQNAEHQVFWGSDLSPPAARGPPLAAGSAARCPAAAAQAALRWPGDAAVG